jgi:hypothetical protein
MRDRKFVFICGLHRSGTSIFFKCLREHPLISAFTDTGVPEDEGQHLQSIYPPAKFYGGAGKFGFAPDAHLTETSPLVTEENRMRLFSEWEKYWDTEKPIFLEKSPPHLITTRFLQAIFPNSYFIILMRHPIAVSFATQSHMDLKSRSTIRSLINHWVHCHEIFNSDKVHLKNYMVVKYERFVRDTSSTLGEIYDFIDVEKDIINERIISDINEKYFKKWERFRGNIFLKSYANTIIERFDFKVSRFGYSLRTPEYITDNVAETGL